MNTNNDLINQYNNSTSVLLSQYYDRGILKKEIRSYEASLWTLQDEFITVLKWSDVEQKGRIENAKMTLNIDGTEKLTFSIPMYYRLDGRLIENPSWYNTRNGNLIKGLRKIKIIFNKGTIDQNIFEFLITNITENHENDILKTDVETEGLAFQELGKIGYKVHLSYEDFVERYETWSKTGKWKKRYDNTELTEEPLQTVSYWCDEAGLTKLPMTLAEARANPSSLNARTWYYTICMNWLSFANGNERDSDEIYEESYTTSWSEDLTPLATENYRVKARSVDIENSNLYNITQTIAEKFEIFCRYEYLYDENYHIVGRIIIFYNNFIQEDEGTISFSYPHSASKISRKMESEAVTTKLFVLNVDNDTILDGYNSIMNAPSNASKEDYILNFDYMLASNGISNEQYQEITPYLKNMRQFNDQLILLQNKLSTYQTQKPEIEAKVTVAKNSIDLDQEQILQNNALYNALDKLDGELDGLMALGPSNPDQRLIQAYTNGKKYISLKNTNKGIVEDSIKLFKNFYLSNSGAILTNEITDFSITYDEFGNINSIDFPNDNDLVVSANSEINWSQICYDCYIPADYKGNVSLIDRKIVPAQAFIDAGYTDFSDSGETYGTLYSSSFTPLGDNNEPKSDDGKVYDIIYTCIDASGKVINETDLFKYFDEIIASGTNPASWMAADAKGKKLFLHYMEIDLNEAFPHTASDAWAETLHILQAEWDQIRAKNNYFGQQNPYDFSIPITLTDYSQLQYFPSTTCAQDSPLRQKTLDSYKTNAATIVNKIYMTYKYDPHLYYEKIIKMWEFKLAQDNALYKEATKELGPVSTTDEDFDLSVYDNDGTTLIQAYNKGLNKKINTTSASIDSLIQDKEEAIHRFERMMGSALREGYWQPEDYDDYGDHHTITGKFSNTNIVNDSGNSAIIGWDTELFTDEQTLDYKMGINKEIEYYPCIDLIGIFGSIDNIPADLDKYSLVWKATNRQNYTYDFDSIKDLQMFAIGSQALIRFINIGAAVSGAVLYKPVLVVVGAKTLAADQLERMLLSNLGEARLEKYSVTVGQNGEINIDHGDTQYDIGTHWLCYKERTFTKPENWSNALYNKFVTNPTINNHRTLIYPRIKFSSLSLKTNTSDLVIKYHSSVSNQDVPLEIGKDYYINTRDTKRSEDNYVMEYYITIKPETLIKYKLNNTFTINYVLSNANTAIYLDALKVSQENAYPKASYEVNVNLLNTNLIHTLYNRRAQIVMINDTELKFKNVFGYISQLDLDLDQPQNDQIEVKNYKTKFEDLFSTIVAQTEEMKRSGAGFIAAAGGEVSMGSKAFEKTLSQNDLIMQAYLDSYFDSSQVVKDRLAELFTEASEILADSNKTLNSMRSLTLENASILSDFAQNVAQELSGQVYRSKEKPTNFKPNDVWIQVDDQDNVLGRYIATSFSTESSAGGTSGFVRTYDGSLASITGAAVTWDAVSGIVDITGQNEINIKSGNSIYIAANEKVDIVGNKEVNIGGTTINICSLSEQTLDPLTNTWSKTGNTTDWSGINLIAGALTDIDNTQVSKILINPTKISMGASELELKAASEINIFASTGAYAKTSAIKINAEEGIYVGAGKGVRLFGGSPDYNVYVGPAHAPNFQKDDIWIKISKVESLNGQVGYDGDSIGTNYYTSFIVNNNEHPNFTIVGIYRANDNWDAYFTEEEIAATTVSSSMTGWSLVTSSNLDSNAKNYIIEKGASLELNSEHVLLGFTNVLNNNATAIELTEQYVIIAAGNQITGDKIIDNNKAITGTTGGLIGAKFTSTSIGMAVTTNGITTAMLMDRNGFTVGSAGIDVTTDNLRDIDNGSYTRINKEGIELGSLADLYINTNNFKLQTYSREKGVSGATHNDGRTILAVGNNLDCIDENSAYNPASGHERIENKSGSSYTTYKLNGSNFIPQVDLLLNKNGLYVRGDIYADNGIFNGTLIASNFKIRENEQDKLWADYFANMPLSYMDAVYDTIESLFDEAGAILSDGAQAVANTHSLTTENAALLATFLDKAKDLNPTVYTSAARPSTFKPGDIWEPASGTYSGNKYIAISYSTKSSTGSGENNTTHEYSNPLGGWNRVSNGSLASITGAGMNIDTAAGTLDLYAGSKISLKAKSQLDLAAGDIQITGNNSINIGSKWVNIGSDNGGINIISTNIDATTTTDSNGKVNTNGVISKIQLDRSGIIMHANTIELMAGNSDTVAALKLDPGNGIYLGASKEIRLFTGVITGGANIQITPTKIHLGVNNAASTSASAAILTANQVLLAVGATVNSNSTTKITSTTSTSGVQIQKDYIGLATGDGTSTSSPRSLISISPTKILIGSAKKGTINSAVDVNESNLTVANIEAKKVIGGYIKIDNSGTYPEFEIGSTGIFKVLTPTMMFNNAASDTDNMIELKQDTTTVLSFSQTNGLSIKGAITATSFALGSDGHSLGINDVNGLRDALNDAASSGGSYNFDGLTNIGWGSSTTDKPSYVALTSSGGLLLGSNNGLVIPRVTPVQLDTDNNNDNTADNMDTIVEINKEHINLDYYNNSGTQTSYIHMNADGLAVNGKRISINGDDVWARDDIIVMASGNSTKPLWQRSRAAIEAYMLEGSVMLDSSGNVVSSDGTTYTRPGGAVNNDWVLIKPYYNNSLTFISNQTAFATFNSPAQLSLSSSNQEPYFADNSGWFKFKVTFSCYVNQLNNNSITPEQRYISVKLLAKHKTLPDRQVVFDYTASDLINVTPRGNENSFPDQFLTAQLRGNIYPTTISLTMSNLTGAEYNICGDQFTLTLIVSDMVGSTVNGGIGITSVQVQAENDSTTTCVPCTVFYYPYNE